MKSFAMLNIAQQGACTFKTNTTYLRRIEGYCRSSHHFPFLLLSMQLKIISISTPEYEAMKTLRAEVLLKPIGVPLTYIDPEKEAADILLGAFDKEDIIGCCILTHVDDDTLQLRQMAVDTRRQGTGVGAAIIAFAEDTAKAKGYKTLMMHAREPVVSFYQKCGYRTSGERFFEVSLPHFKMEKRLA